MQHASSQGASLKYKNYKQYSFYAQRQKQKLSLDTLGSSKLSILKCPEMLLWTTFEIAKVSLQNNKELKQIINFRFFAGKRCSSFVRNKFYISKNAQNKDVKLMVHVFSFYWGCFSFFYEMWQICSICFYYNVQQTKVVK